MLKFFVKNYPIVADHVKEAMGELLFESFLVNFQIKFCVPKLRNLHIQIKMDPDGLYARMTAIQADVCRSNKVHIPYRSLA